MNKNEKNKSFFSSDFKLHSTLKIAQIIALPRMRLLISASVLFIRLRLYRHKSFGCFFYSYNMLPWLLQYRMIIMELWITHKCNGHVNAMLTKIPIRKFENSYLLFTSACMNRHLRICFSLPFMTALRSIYFNRYLRTYGVIQEALTYHHSTNYKNNNYRIFYDECETMWNIKGALCMGVCTIAQCTQHAPKVN